MIERSNQPLSYLIGTTAGAITGALALDLYVRINPLFLGSAAELAASYISGDLATVQSILMVGAGIGAIAGAVRTAVDHRWDVQKNTITKLTIDTATGFVAAPLASMGKCMILPMASELWKDLPWIAQALTCSAIGGLTATVIAPVGIAAATAARVANQYVAKPAQG